MMANRAGLSATTALGVLMLATTAPAVAQTSAPTPLIKPPVLVIKKPLQPQYRNVRSFYRNVRSFWGDVNPFYRNVRSFWGDVDPYYRNVRSFWGTMDPAQMASVAGAPTYAGVGPFWEGLGTQWEGIATKWQTAGAYGPSNAVTYTDVATRMRVLVATSNNFWGAAVTKRTGKSFEAGFANPLFAKYGVSLNDPASLAKLSAIDQSAFFMDWYDGLMIYSGTDHADWWMNEVNWSPKLTQTMGTGVGSTLGLIDYYSTSSADIRGKVTNLTPNAVSNNGHGEGVLGLIVGAHDGKGVMGIAPGARVIAYNPFDVNGGAEWVDVAAGIQAVAARGATVINLSLGAPGVTLSSEWQKIFTKSEINTHKDKTLYIIAAGNDGVSQTGLINMKGALDTTFIVVGSVGPTGISEFSNRPGNACVTDGAECKGSPSLKDSGYIRNRFITAPGELILVSDGAGGLVRQSGTSLAAPMVAGAVALIQDRWPWMREKPRDIAMVILGSARDAGAPGIDDVYGVGILDVEAAMSPLNFNTLKFYLTSSNGGTQNEVSVSTLKSRGLQTSWATNNMYFHAFEKLDQVERDFLIPLSSRLYGSTRGGEYFQDFVYNRMTSWLSGSRFAGSSAAGFTDGVRLGTGADNWSVSMTSRLVNDYVGKDSNRSVKLLSTIAVEAPSGQLGFSFGNGDGAVALGGQRNMAMASDFDPYAGGTNPLLGFANGGTHGGAHMTIARGLDVRAGFSQQRGSLGGDLYNVTDAQDRVTIGGSDRYRASVTSLRVDYRATSWLDMSVSMTRLEEPNSLLGVRSIEPTDLSRGTRTSGLTLGVNASLGSGVTLFGSGTKSRSRSGDSDSMLRTGDSGVTGTSYQVGVARQGLLGKHDRLRMSIAQPLRLSAGEIEITGVQVIDRQTGEKGLVTERFPVAGTQTRRLVVEGLYGIPLLDGRGEVGLFGRGEVGDLDNGTPRLMVGSQFRLAL